LIGLSNVRAQDDTRLVTFHNWTLRIRPGSAPTARLLLLVHGWTGDENSMWVFVRNFPPSYWIVAPRAPFAAPAGGYSWRPQPTTPGQLPQLEDLRSSAATLTELADAYAAENDLKGQEFDVIGFSQGAAVTNVLALLHPARIGRAGVLAGFVPAGAETLVDKRPLAGKQFFVAHGTLDEMVKIETARQSAELLEQAGANVTFCEDAVGHKVSAACLRALQEFFT
jgi:phospholipase/carboxylesterase